MYWNNGASVVEAQTKNKSAAAIFPQWSDNAQGMAQILMWTALEIEGLGASLQHMNAFPSVEAAIKKFCDVPEDYSLVAHIVYGDHPGNHPEKPAKLPLEETLRTL